MLARHRKPARKRSFVVAAVVLGVGGATVAGVASAQTFDRHRPVVSSAPAARQAAAKLGTATTAAGSRRHRPRPTATTSAPPTTAPTSAAPTTTAPTTEPTTEAPITEAPTTVPTTAAPTTAAPTTPATSAPASPPAATTAPAGDPVIAAALEHINSARTANGLSPLTLSAQLSQASQAHNALMAGGCGLSHQCPGEAGLGDRFTAAGVSWTSAGENIGQGNAADNPAQIIAAANGLTDLMLAEVAPNDGHRRNLLNAGFKRIGLAVTRDASGEVWFTQDFVN